MCMKNGLIWSRLGSEQFQSLNDAAVSLLTNPLIHEHHFVHGKVIDHSLCDFNVNFYIIHALNFPLEQFPNDFPVKIDRE